MLLSSRYNKKWYYILGMNIGNSIKKHRMALGLTQSEFAEKIGTNQQVVTNYERNLRKPPADKIPEIAKALNVTLDELYGISEPSEEKQRKAPNAREKQMQDVYEKLMPSDQRAILKQSKGLLK